MENDMHDATNAQYYYITRALRTVVRRSAAILFNKKNI